ncbi:MAG: response regulator transcription factor [Anaerolineales bacterium]|nr:response regulator transcription factor [Anaerolineales bacterium]
MPLAKSILVVDDETTIREVVRRYLERDGFKVREAADGYACLDALAEHIPDLIVLDLMLPGIDGLTITRQLRLNPKYKGIPIVMLTAKGETNDRIRGLDLGADDYIPKPFAPREVVSRVNAVLRRAGSTLIEPGERLDLGALTIDAGARTVSISNQNIALSAKEFDLLYHFAQHPRQVFTREQLLEQVWGYEFFGDASTVTVHIRRLREKIEADPSDPKYIMTVWGVGYKFEFSNE